MHPSELRELMQRFVDDSMSAEDDAQLATLIAEQPSLADELERFALEELEADSQGIDNLFAQQRSHIQASVSSSSDHVKHAILEKISKRGRVIQMRRFVLAGGSVAAAVILGIALTSSFTSPVQNPSTPGTGSGTHALGPGQAQDETRVQLGSGAVGFFERQFYDREEGVTLDVEKGTLVRVQRDAVELIGGQAIVQVQSGHSYELRVNQSTTKLQGPSALLVTIEGTDGIDQVVDDDRKLLTRRFNSWLDRSNLNFSLKLLAGQDSARFIAHPGASPEVLKQGVERFIFGERPELSSSKAREASRNSWDHAFDRYDSITKDGRLSGKEIDIDTEGFDLNKDGSVSRAEFSKGMRSRELRARERSGDQHSLEGSWTSYDMLFRTHDENRDGLISASELEAGDQNWQADLDGNGEISRDELRRAARKLEQPGRAASNPRHRSHEPRNTPDRHRPTQR